MASAVADVPALVTIDQRDTRTRYLDVFIRGEAFSILRINVNYGVRFFDGVVGPTSLGPLGRYSFSWTDARIETEGGWRVRVDLNRDYEEMRSLYHNDYYPEYYNGFANPVCDGLGLFDLEIDLLIGSEDWNPPGSVFDPNVLAQPGILTNVENGFGLVTGGYDESRSLIPSTDALGETGFFDYMDGRTPAILSSELCGGSF